MSIHQKGWRVYVMKIGPVGERFLEDYGSCAGDSDEEAIDDALQIIGDLSEGWFLESAYAVREEAIGRVHRLGRVRRPTFERTGIIR